MPLRLISFVCVLVYSALLFFTAPTYAQTSSSSLSINNFFDAKRYGSFDLSPDGRFVAIADQRKDAHILLIMDLDNRSDVKAIGLGSGDLNWARWATNERLIVSISVERTVKLPPNVYTVEGGRRTGLMSGVRYSRLLSIDRNGGDAVELMSDASDRIRRSTNLTKITSILSDDPNHILMPAQDKKLSLFKVNILDGTSSLVEKGGASTYAWDVDKAGIPIARYDSSSNGRYVRVFAKSEQKWKKLSTVKFADLESFRVVAPTETPGTILVSGAPEGVDKTGVYRYNVLTQKYGRKISSDPDVDIYSSLLGDNGDYLASSYFKDRLTYKFKDEALQRHYRAIDSYFDASRNIRINSVSANGARWLLFVDGPDEPGAYYDYDVNRTKVQFIAKTHEGLDRRKLGRSEFIKYTARDGQKLSGYLHSPAANAHANTPLVVMPHGGPEIRDYFGFDVIAHYLTSRGYRVFQPNFRGSGGYGKAFREMGKGEWGGAMQDDITDGVDYLVRQSKASKRNICIAGASYGGYASLMGAVKTPEAYNCIIAMNAVTDLPEILKFDKDKFGRKSEVYQEMMQRVGDPKADKLKLQSTSPVYNAAGFTKPVLIIHGSEDDVVPVEQGRVMAKALSDNGKSVRYVEVGGMNHSFFGSAENSDDPYFSYKKILREIESFLAQHLKK